MKDLIKVTKQTIGIEEVNAVDARGLHEFLEVGTQFSKWVQRKIADYNFTQGIDFITIVKNDYSPPRIEYTVSLDMAKELSMVEKNHKGKEARKYFIKCEKKAMGFNLKEGLPAAVDNMEAAIKLAGLFGFTGNQAILSANKAVKKLNGVDCMEVLDIQGLATPENKQYFIATELGKMEGISAVKFNKALMAAGLQEKIFGKGKKWKWSVTNTGEDYCQVLDTGKKHSDGTPIQQVKWCKDVMPLVITAVAAMN